MPEEEKVEKNELEIEQEEFGDAFKSAMESVPDGTPPTKKEDTVVDPDKKVEKEEEDPNIEGQEDEDPNKKILEKFTPSEVDQVDYKDELEKERQRNASWDGRIKAANQRADDATAEKDKLQKQLDEKQSSTSNEDTKEVDELLSEFDTQFPTLKQAVTIIATQVAREEVKLAIADAMVQVKPMVQDVEDLKVTTATTAKTSHDTTIKDAHPDLNKIISGGDSSILLKWIMSHPPYMRDGMLRVTQSGTSAEVVDLLQDFKNATEWVTIDPSDINNQQDTNTNSEKSDKESKLDSMLGVESDITPPLKEAAGADDFSGAFNEAASRKT